MTLEAVLVVFFRDRFRYPFFPQALLRRNGRGRRYFHSQKIEPAPDRVLWGTDFPHPNVKWMPNDGELVDLFAASCDESVGRIKGALTTERPLSDAVRGAPMAAAPRAGARTWRRATSHVRSL